MATKIEAPSTDAQDLLVTRKVGSQYRRGSNLKKATQTANEQHRIKTENNRLSQRLATIDKRKLKPATTDANNRVKDLRRDTGEKRKKMALKKLDKENDIIRDRLKKVKPAFAMPKDGKSTGGSRAGGAGKKDQKDEAVAAAAADTPSSADPAAAAAAEAEAEELEDGNDEYEDDQNAMEAAAAEKSENPPAELA